MFLARNKRCSARGILHIVSILFIGFLGFSRCTNIDPGFGNGNARFSVYYNDPGVDEFTMTDKQIDRELTDLIDSAKTSVYLAVYNFNKQSIIDAILRANIRNLDVRVVGDIDEFYTLGYQTMQHEKVDMILGNSSGIQHNKFAVIDSKYVFMGTGNLSNTDMLRNNNNWYIIENEEMARLYTDEFMQMYNGQFGAKKRPRSSSYEFTANNHKVEVFFSPYDGQRAMDRLIELVNSAQKTIHYMIFAYTHDELAAAMVKAARQKNILVQGTHDSTFINGVSEEAPRLFAASYTNKYTDVGNEVRHKYGPFPRVDGNENTSIRNNPAHGGKMHAKTLIIDAGTPDAIMATGSFNWSNNAIVNNDENMIILHDPSIAETVFRQFQETWSVARDLEFRLSKNGHTAQAGDVVISEVHWAGASSGTSLTAKDDFIEIYNNTSGPIDISHWSIQWGPDARANVYPVPDSSNEYYENRQACPGSFGQYTSKALANIICPGQHRIFYSLPSSGFAEPVMDEILTYSPGGGIERSRTPGKRATRHFRISGVKKFHLNNSQLKVRLYDKSMRLIDEAGDGGNAFAGELTYEGGKSLVHSMIRRGYNDNSKRMSGELAAAWGSTRKDPAALVKCTSANALDFDGCFDAKDYSYVSPGYANESAKPPVVKRIVLEAADKLKVMFNSNMSNCPTSGITSPSASGVTGDFGNRVFTLNSGLTNPMTNTSITLGASCKDFENSTVTGTFSISGFSSALANVKLSKVIIANGYAHDISLLNNSNERRRFVKFQAQSSGSIRNLRVLRYSLDGLEELHRFSELYLQSGDSVIVSLTKPSRDQGSNGTTQERLASNHDLYNPTSDDATKGIPKRPPPSGSATFHVYSTATSFSGTDDVIILTYCGIGPQSGCTENNYGVQDVVYYSSRGRNINQNLMEGALTHIYDHLNTFWPLPERPIDELNDVTLQRAAVCTNDTPDGTGDCVCSSTARGIERTDMNKTGKSAWRCL